MLANSPATASVGDPPLLAGMLAALQLVRSIPGLPIDKDLAGSPLPLPESEWPSLLNNVLSATHLLVCGPNVHFVHGPILAQRSPYFQCLLDGKFRDAGQDVIRLAPPFPDRMQTVLEHIYGCRLLDGATRSLRVLANARYLAIDALYNDCLRSIAADWGAACASSDDDLVAVVTDLTVVKDMLAAIKESSPGQLLSAVEKLASVGALDAALPADPFAELLRDLDMGFGTGTMTYDDIKAMVQRPIGRKVLRMLGVGELCRAMNGFSEGQVHGLIMALGDESDATLAEAPDRPWQFEINCSPAGAPALSIGYIRSASPETSDDDDLGFGF
ncbi:hypothetical protein HK101_001242 [Irineochytrium annulatum]|nr:hypothetical protein HK101_001242 [Irineochytrium annulatum]